MPRCRGYGRGDDRECRMSSHYVRVQIQSRYLLRSKNAWRTSTGLN